MKLVTAPTFTLPTDGCNTNEYEARPSISSQSDLGVSSYQGFGKRGTEKERVCNSVKVSHTW